MKQDWDDRARENARWFINTFKTEQTEEEFDATGRRDFEGLILSDLAVLTDRRHPRGLRLLEIGCGIGRMSRYLAETFGEVEAVDVSGEMIRQARARLGHLSNLHFRETNGIDLSLFPDDYFDVVFCAYVFQHVPSAEAIESNIREAYRVLKPRGVFKFVTNAVSHAEYLAMEKDTWSGAPFPEQRLRELARDLGAQLMGVVGDGTQYCWTLLRKRRMGGEGSVTVPVSPRIISIGRAEDLGNASLAPRHEEMYLGLVLSGIPRELVDAGILEVELGGRRLVPCYAGPMGMSAEGLLRSQGEVLDDRIQVNVRIPADLPAGETELKVHLSGDLHAGPVKVTMPPVTRTPPHIIAITNAVDGGLDLHVHGPKSNLRILAENLTPGTRLDELSISVNEEWRAPQAVRYLAGNGIWEISLQLPVRLPAGDASFQLRSGELLSAPLATTLRA